MGHDLASHGAAAPLGLLDLGALDALDQRGKVRTTIAQQGAGSIPCAEDKAGMKAFRPHEGVCMASLLGCSLFPLFENVGVN